MVRVHHRPSGRVLAVCIVLLFACTFAALLAVKSGGALHPPLTREQAKAAALADPGVRPFVRSEGFTDVKVLALDETHWRVTFFNHGHTVLDASVGPHGRIDAEQGHRPGVHATGSNILWHRVTLIGLALLFVAATAVVPLRRTRNLDAVAIAGGLVAVLLLYDSQLVAGDAWAGGGLLAYAALRCAWTGLRAPADPTNDKPLYTVLLARLPAVSRKRIAILITGALLLAGSVITVTSTGISDVAFAGLAGATSIQRGEPPYGHITHEVVHGDTYPIVTYVLYLPFTLLFGPVDDSFDNLDPALWLNAIALVGAALLAFMVGSRASPERDRAHGLALAVAWLACPAVLMAASGGGNDVPTAFLVMAGLAVAARAALGSTAFALATAAKLGPLAGLVLYVASLRGRARAAGVAVTLAVALGCVALLLALGGTGAISDMIHALAFQFRRGSFHSVWTQLGSSGAQAAMQAAALTFIAFATVLLTVTRSRNDLRRVAALGAAGVLALQLSANYWTFAYFAWALPLILVALFPPARPRSPQPEPHVP